MYAIRRIEHKRGYWCWTVHLRRYKKSILKSFFDIKCGGSGKAKAAAVAWRNEQLARIDGLTYREFHQIRRSDNRSGAPGVMFLTPKSMPKGMWQAKLRRPNGKHVTKSFSVARYGNKEAFKRAVAARAEMVRLVEDRPYLNHPTAKKFAALRQAKTARLRHQS